MLLNCKITSANATIFQGKLQTYDGMSDSFSIQMQLDGEFSNTDKQPIREAVLKY